MSEFVTAPPPPSSPSQPSYDFAKPFGFVFQDPDWLSKILIGGLFEIASIFIIGIFFVAGYCARLARTSSPGWNRRCRTGTTSASTSRKG